ncbi:phosphoenolpyruvate--protein phosphotransferase [candidate division KSB1 bacterium 4572_119]|nr:MAG: phosphoenolpyruvate--protein phosphotransferase [candidate division KSB1 bacterium 4572_119]
MKRNSPKKMIKLEGIAASPGIVIGQVFKLTGDVIKVEERDLQPDEISQEIKNFNKALETTKRQLFDLQSQAKTKIGKEGEQIFDAHQMLLEDPVIIKETIDLIKKLAKNADFVYYQVVQKFQKSLEKVDDEFFLGRVADLKDVKRRLIRNIQGGKKMPLSGLTQKAIVVANDLTPSETVLLDKQKVMAFATDRGGKNSHAAIMARSMEIPSVVGTNDISELASSGDTLIIDGINGKAILNPTPSSLNKYLKKRQEYDEETKQLSKLKNLPSRSLDGKDIELSANLDFPDEVTSAINYGARGVGLFRTEYIYLTREQLPALEEEHREYARVAKKVAPHPLIIRTLDIGGDKNPCYIKFPEEENPVLGWRGIRFCLENPKIFKSQLNAILQASVSGNVKILLPMISCLEEVHQAKNIIDQVKGELLSKKIEFNENIEIGIMIEVPSAAIMAEHLAEEVDFLSIGTNDLIQYTLAADRGNQHVANLSKRLPPSVLRIIKNVVDAGHKKGVWVGMCGEMASDPLATLILLGLDLDELSVSPAALPEIKKIIRSISYTDAQKISEKALQMKSSEQIEIYMRNVFYTRFKKKIV